MTYARTSERGLVLRSGNFVRIHTIAISEFTRAEDTVLETVDRLPIELRAAYLALHRCSDTRFAKYGVTADQFVLLATLARGRALTQRELAARMPSDPSTVRAMLVLLEERGLVSRNTHPTDGRKRTAVLTKKGLRKYQQVFKAGKSIRDQMVISLSTAETKMLVDLLSRVSKSLLETTTILVSSSHANDN